MCVLLFDVFIHMPLKNQSSWGKEVDFRDIKNVSSNILAENWNFKKLKDGLVDERPLITTTLLSSYHWKNPCTFLLAKEKSWKCVFNTNCELSQSRSEKKNYSIQHNFKLAI